MKNLFKTIVCGVILTLILFGMSSCSKKDDCSQIVAVVPISAPQQEIAQAQTRSQTNDYTCTGNVNMNAHQNQNVINLDAQGGTLCINGELNLNSNVTITVFNGNLKLSGAGNLSGTIIVHDGDLVINGSYNLNSGFTTQSTNFYWTGSGIINCGVNIVLYNDYQFNGSFVWNCPFSQVVTIDGTLSNDSPADTRQSFTMGVSCNAELNKPFENDSGWWMYQRSN